MYITAQKPTLFSQVSFLINLCVSSQMADFALAGSVSSISLCAIFFFFF